MEKSIRIIKSDLKTLNKLETNNNFKRRLIDARKVAESLGAMNSESVYYRYQMHLKQLTDIGFFELTALERFENTNYFNELKELYEKIYYEKPKFENHNKVIKFKRR